MYLRKTDLYGLRNNMKHAVVYVVYDNLNKRVLSEKRRADSKFFPNMVVFPSGTVEENEKDNLDQTLIRESYEELGIVPTEYACLDTQQPLYSGEKTIIHPYVITKWNGEIPSYILDKGNPILWQSFEEAATSEVATRAVIVERVKKYLATTEENL